nr:PREDICTED: phostensin [Paralichthys olivaceus]
MSVSSLPEWKQLLLEKKRREEEERERREKEEEEKLASMPAWKRGIIQRRKAKQDSVGDREKDRDMCFLQVDFRCPSDTDTDSSVTVNLGSEPSLSPDPGLWLDADPRSVSQVSVETIVPLHENPFIRTQTAWRKGKDADVGNESEREKDKSSPRGQDGDSGRGRDIELKIERFRDLTDNIIIIEQDRKGSDERRGKWREAERERPEEDHQGNRGMKMNLREILAGGGSVTEIRASEVLIIKPSTTPEERSTGGKEKEDGEMKCGMDARRESRELRTDISWMREKEKEPGKEKERPWGQALVIKDRKESLEDNVFVERGGRVSQLLSKFGQLPKPPSRSKSSDNFLRPGRRKYSDEDDQRSAERKVDGRNMLLKGIPKRSFSFSDRVICAKENGLDNERCYEWKRHERTHSDKIVAPWVDVAGLGRDATAKIKMGCAHLLDKDRLGKHKDGCVKTDIKAGSMLRRNDADISIQHRSEVKRVEPIDKWAAERSGNGDGDEGFTVASVKNTEGISFARRVPIRQDGKARAEKEAKRLAGEKSLERELSVEKDPEERDEAQVSDKKDFLRGDGIESAIPAETMHSYVMAASADTTSPCLSAESHYRHESAFTECSSLLCTVTDMARDPHRGAEWTGPRGPYLAHSVLSQHTEELISKIEKIGDTTVYGNEKGERPSRAVHELTKECRKDGQHYSDVASESLVQDATPRSPKRVAPPGPLEIQIPRTVFYVAEEEVEVKKVAGQSDEGRDWEGGQGVERRDSWRIGKPLSRIESLREKIRQKELERLRQMRDGEGSAAAEDSDTPPAGDMYDERGTEIEQEWEAAAHIRKKLVDADTAQEDAAAQASTAAFDVTQEVLKTCPQLPVSVPHSQAAGGEEVSSECDAAAAEVLSDGSRISEDEDETPKHEEEQLRCHGGRQESREEEREEEEKLSEEEVEEYTTPLDPTQALSPSPPHPNSLAAMSRIYNLETVGSRSGLCLRDRTGPSVHLIKVTPRISNSQQGDGRTLPGGDVSGVQTIQRQIEQFQLKEQEALNSTNSLLRDKETQRQQSPRAVLKQQVKDEEKDQSLRVCSPTAQLKQTITVNPSFLRSQSPDTSLKPSDSAPTPASSPCSPSPSQSPSVSPSPTPSPTLFSIRSASGVQVKRGATITIKPKRPVGAGGGGEGTASAPSTGSTSAGSSPAKTPSQKAQTTPAAAEPIRKKYPTAEQIVVIGGYLNLEKSCLVKNRGTPKRGNVCFNEDRLEQVCEYPSETSLMACVPHPYDLGRTEKLQGDEAQEKEADVDGEAIVTKSTRNVGTATGRGLRVDESCARSSSPKLPL